MHTQIQEWLKPKLSHPLWEKLCSHFTTGVAAGGVTHIIFDRNTQEEKYLKLSRYMQQF